MIGAAAIHITVLLVFIILTGISFYRVDQLAGILIVPYAAWVSFATALTITIWRLNVWTVMFEVGKRLDICLRGLNTGLTGLSSINEWKYTNSYVKHFIHQRFSCQYRNKIFHQNNTIQLCTVQLLLNGKWPWEISTSAWTYFYILVAFSQTSHVHSPYIWPYIADIQMITLLVFVVLTGISFWRKDELVCATAVAIETWKWNSVH